MRYAIEKGAKVVAGFDINKKLIGKDVKAVLGGKQEYGAKIYDVNATYNLVQNRLYP